MTRYSVRSTTTTTTHTGTRNVPVPGRHILSDFTVNCAVLVLQMTTHSVNDDQVSLNATPSLQSATMQPQQVSK